MMGQRDPPSPMLLGDILQESVSEFAKLIFGATRGLLESRFLARARQPMFARQRFNERLVRIAFLAPKCMVEMRDNGAI
jgi:hypothetical protein